MRAVRWCVCLCMLAACQGLTHDSQTTDDISLREVKPKSLRQDDQSEPIRPLPVIELEQPEIIELGGRLFHDPRLSLDGSISCASCHRVEFGGDDGLPVSIGIHGGKGLFNTPTIVNSRFNIVQFWDGRGRAIGKQFEAFMFDHDNMGFDGERIIDICENDKFYSQAFSHLYLDGLQLKNIKHAIAEFGRSLVSVNSRFDKWLRGDGSALSRKELAGYMLFKSIGCVNCHQGKNVGGNMFQKLGAIRRFSKKDVLFSRSNQGRYYVTQDEEDQFVFRVPSLRMAVMTAPYLHDGSMKKLEDVIYMMGAYQLGIDLSPPEIMLIIKFLETLPGKKLDMKPYKKWVAQQVKSLADTRY